jgi:hypothetical protein
MTLLTILFKGTNGIRQIASTGVPIAGILFALPWVSPNGPQSFLALNMALGFALASISVLMLYLLFAILGPDGWKPKAAAATAETITLWLVAGIVIAGVF